MAVILRDVTSIPLADYPTGVFPVLSRIIPDAAEVLYMEFARSTTLTPTIWPNITTKLMFEFEASVDGGVRWLKAGGFGMEGGIFVKFTGEEATVSSLLVALPLGVSRLLRATGTILGGPLRTQGVIELRTLV